MIPEKCSCKHWGRCDCGKYSLQVVSIKTGFSGESADYCGECANKLFEKLERK
ncbi:hypothetical protein LCGC14_1424230 [marine sediment metagenome]|uniref:Uncharacterized protein n=1 Tax=marine sediment metagenome TaxID=412755 RepID=A0A0F9M5W8_9ZZZZ